MKPGFAVDIDNVLADAEYEVQRIYQELTGELWPSALYASAGGLDKSFFNQDLIEQIFDYFHVRSIPYLSVMPGAKAALQMIKFRYRIIIITARRPMARQQTVEWLKTHNLPYDALYFAGEKTEVVDNIVLAVDDHPDHAQEYANHGIQVFLMDQPWNQLFQAKGVTRVSGWDELLRSL